jgi:hypothetical protein
MKAGFAPAFIFSPIQTQLILQLKLNPKLKLKLKLFPPFPS